MENDLNPNETAEFLWRRLTEDCPPWAIGVPVLFALMVVGLIVLFRPQNKLMSAVIGAVVVGVIALIYLPLAYILRPFFSWMVILLPIMAVALFYVVLMYLRDARSVHPVWAIFLGLLRTCVYLMLAVVFLLPGCQHFEKQEHESKVVFLFDVSGSLYTIDDLPEIGQDPATLPMRQDKILRFLTAQAPEKRSTSFVDEVLAKSPLTAYRFGPVLDETDILNLRAGKTLSQAEWKQWLFPDKKDVAKPNIDQIKIDHKEIKTEEDRKKEFDKEVELYNRRIDLVDTLKSGTNIGGAALQAHKLENNSFVQAIVVISDGQSNVGSDDARSEFLARVNSSKRTIPVFTVGVGQFRQPASIRIDDIQAPEETRPDDKFPIRVPVVGSGLHEEEFTITLEVSRVKDVTGKPVQDKKFILPSRKGSFKGAGDHPQDLVDFEIDVQDLKKIRAQDDKNGDLEGEWHIVARVPRHPKEPFPDPEHVTQPIKVQVQKRALRVLLFAGGATREYQFLRTILYREMNEKRMEMVIYLQTGKEDHIDQDVDPERLLADFPNKIGPNDPGQKFMSLSDYDVVIAFDPDWSKLTTKQLGALKEWVGTHAGGVIFVAGPVFTYQLARPGGRDINALLSIFPVVLKDNRLHGLGVVGAGLGHDSSRPYALTFTAAAKQFDFLKLDEAGDSPTAGWGGFFWNNEKFKAEPGKEVRPRKGFYSYYPVERLKPDSSVVATFAGPKEARINGGKDEPPFLVSMRYGSGKTLYVGSGEFWRLRSYKDGYHERLWIKMARYVAAGATQQKKYGRILMPRTVAVGVVNFEAQIKGKDLLPLSRDLIPTVRVRRTDKNKDEKAEEIKFDLRAKPTDADWQGYFAGSINMKEPGEYEFQLPIPNTTEMLKQSLVVRKPNPELDNVRTNFGYLYQMASPSEPILARLPAAMKRKLEPLLEVPQDQNPGEKSAKRLFFPLSKAAAIADCLVPVQPKTDIVKGRFQDLWDAGVDSGRVVQTFWAALLTPIGVGLIGMILLLIMRQWLGGLAFFGACVVLGIVLSIALLLFTNITGEELPVQLSYLLTMVVGLLGTEWLARKILRLA